MVKLTDEDILRRYDQGSGIEKIIKWVSRNERIKVSEARPKVQAVILEAQRKIAGENKDE